VAIAGDWGIANPSGEKPGLEEGGTTIWVVWLGPDEGPAAENPKFTCCEEGFIDGEGTVGVEVAGLNGKGAYAGEVDAEEPRSRDGLLEAGVAKGLGNDVPVTNEC
jgi:hypothetical protein